MSFLRLLKGSWLLRCLDFVLAEAPQKGTGLRGLCDEAERFKRQPTPLVNLVHLRQKNNH